MHVPVSGSAAWSLLTNRSVLPPPTLPLLQANVALMHLPVSPAARAAVVGLEIGVWGVCMASRHAFGWVQDRREDRLVEWPEKRTRRMMVRSLRNSGPADARRVWVQSGLLGASARDVFAVAYSAVLERSLREALPGGEPQVGCAGLLADVKCCHTIQGHACLPLGGPCLPSIHKQGRPRSGWTSSGCSWPQAGPMCRQCWTPFTTSTVSAAAVTLHLTAGTRSTQTETCTQLGRQGSPISSPSTNASPAPIALCLLTNSLLPPPCFAGLGLSMTREIANVLGVYNGQVLTYRCGRQVVRGHSSRLATQPRGYAQPDGNS